MKANVLGSVRCLPARTVPRDEEEATSLSSTSASMCLDGVTSFERRERTAVNRRQRRLRSYHHCHHRRRVIGRRRAPGSARHGRTRLAIVRESEACRRVPLRKGKLRLQRSAFASDASAFGAKRAFARRRRGRKADLDRSRCPRRGVAGE